MTTNCYIKFKVYNHGTSIDTVEMKDYKNGSKEEVIKSLQDLETRAKSKGYIEDDRRCYSSGLEIHYKKTFNTWTTDERGLPLCRYKYQYVILYVKTGEEKETPLYRGNIFGGLFGRDPRYDGLD